MAGITEEMEELASRLKDLHLTPAWDAGVTQGWGRRDAPRMWHWKDVKSALDEMSGISVGDESVERRLITLSDGLADKFATTGTISSAIQMVLPGEVAPPHRHAAAALRFVIEGSGAYTVVNGDKVDMQRGDLLLTPSWMWHEHEMDEGGEPMYWLDALDFPFVKYLDAEEFEAFPAGQRQKIVRAANTPTDVGRNGLVNAHAISPPYSSAQLVYHWRDTEEVLRQALRTKQPDPVDGLAYEYVNPLNGKHCLATIACFAHGYPEGFISALRKRTSSSICVVMEGTGALIAGDTRLEFIAGDIFVEPAATWCQYEIAEETLVFRVSDLPMLEPFGLDRLELSSSDDAKPVR